MNDNERDQTLTRVIRRNAYQAYPEAGESSETANNCTMFLIGAVAFLAGFWALVCLISAVLQEGPMLMFKQLAAAVTGL